MSTTNNDTVPSQDNHTLTPARNNEFIEIQIPDLTGKLRGKLLLSRKEMVDVCEATVSSIIFALNSGDRLSYPSFGLFKNGFPKVIAKPDMSTAVKPHWHSDTLAVLVNCFDKQNQALSLDPRRILKQIADLFEDKELIPKIGFEYECYIFHADEEILDSHNYTRLKPFGCGIEYCSVSRYPRFQELAKEFMSKMSSIGIQIEAFHTELGHGLFEFSIAPMTPLEAADAATRAKMYLKELCAEHELITSFMPSQASMNLNSYAGAHQHVSLWCDDDNILWDEGKSELTLAANHFVGGLLHTMSDLHILFRPWINSYRRMDHRAWNPDYLCWGLDNHCAAVRLITGNNPSNNTRFEHRTSGCDVNPYLSIAAILAGGWYGIEHELMPPKPTFVQSMDNDEFTRLPSTFLDSVNLFEKSSITKSLFPQEFIELITFLKRDEWANYSEWLASENRSENKDEISEWEYRHYFEWI